MKDPAEFTKLCNDFQEVFRKQVESKLDVVLR